MILTSSESNGTAATGAAPSRANYGATYVGDSGRDDMGKGDEARVNAPKVCSKVSPTYAEELVASSEVPNRTLEPRFAIALVMLSAAAGLFYDSTYCWRSTDAVDVVQENVPIEGVAEVPTKCNAPQGSFHDSCNDWAQTVTYDGELCRLKACCARGTDASVWASNTLNIGTYHPNETPELSTNPDGCLEGTAAGWNLETCEWQNLCDSYHEVPKQCKEPQGSFDKSCRHQTVYYVYEEQLCTLKVCCNRGTKIGAYTLNVGTYQPYATPILSTNPDGCLEGAGDGWTRETCEYDSCHNLIDVPTQCKEPQGSFQDSCDELYQFVTYDGEVCKFYACCARGKGSHKSKNTKCTFNVGTFQPYETPVLSTNPDGCLEGAAAGWTLETCDWNSGLCTENNVQCL